MAYVLGHPVHNSKKTSLNTQWWFEPLNPLSGYAIDRPANRDDFFSRHRVDCVTDHADNSAAAVNERMESDDRIFSCARVATLNLNNYVVVEHVTYTVAQ